MPMELDGPHVRGPEDRRCTVHVFAPLMLLSFCWCVCAGARQVGVGVVTGLVHDDVGYMEIQVSVWELEID
jgi:hypothetical protein